MKKTITVLTIAGAAIGFGFFAGASGSGCCVIPQAQAATAFARLTTLHIEGMTCGSCATAVRHVLKSVEGVKDAQVSFAEKKGVVTYDSAKVKPDEIAKAVNEKLPAYTAKVIK